LIELHLEAPILFILKPKLGKDSDQDLVLKFWCFSNPSL